MGGGGVEGRECTGEGREGKGEGSGAGGGKGGARGAGVRRGP
jgi:hypothetical protein